MFYFQGSEATSQARNVEVMTDGRYQRRRVQTSSNREERKGLHIGTQIRGKETLSSKDQCGFTYPINRQIGLVLVP